MRIERLECCGLFELCGIQSTTPKEAVLAVCRNWFDDDEQGAYILFTTVEGSNGRKLAQYIRDNKLGEVNKQRPAVNANTGNMLTFWVWRVDKRVLESFWKKNKPKDEDDEYDEDEDEENF